MNWFKTKLRYIPIIFLIAFLPVMAFGLDIDTDLNDAVDWEYGGTNNVTQTAAAAAILGTADSVTSGDNYPTFSNTAASDTVDELFADLESYLAGISTPNEATVEDYIFDADPESVTGRWEWQDNIYQMFGNDEDFGAGYDADQSHWTLKVAIDSTANVDEDPFAAADTTLTVTSSSPFWTNCIIKIDSEYIKVSSIDDGTTLTVVRGVNASTDAQHATGTDIYIFNPILYVSSSGIGSKATTAPEIAGHDSDSATNDTAFADIRADQFAGSIDWDFTTTTEDSEVSTSNWNAMVGGTKTSFITLSGANQNITMNKPVDAGTNAISTTGLVTGGVKTVVDADGGDPDAYCYGGVWFASGTGTITLPPVAAGMQLTVENHTAEDVLIDPDGTEVLRLNGTALGAGVAITGTDLGDGCVLTYYSAGVWSAFCSGYE